MMLRQWIRVYFTRAGRHGLGTYYPEIDEIDREYDGYVERDVTDYGEYNQVYVENMIQKYKRLSLGSIDPDNVAKYEAKLREWEGKLTALDVAKTSRIDNDLKNDTIKENKVVAVDNVHYIGKIDKNIYSCVSEDIMTDEVVITDKQIEHIKERHPNDYENYYSFVEEIIKDPDYILEANKPNTAFILKHIYSNQKNYELILRLKTSDDPEKYKNSIITFLKVEEKRYKRYLRTKKILYKKE